jgi:hypothetical protein
MAMVSPGGTSKEALTQSLGVTVMRYGGEISFIFGLCWFNVVASLGKKQIPSLRYGMTN